MISPIDGIDGVKGSDGLPSQPMHQILTNLQDAYKAYQDNPSKQNAAILKSDVQDLKSAIHGKGGGRGSSAEELLEEQQQLQDAINAQIASPSTDNSSKITTYIENLRGMLS